MPGSLAQDTPVSPRFLDFFSCSLRPTSRRIAFLLASHHRPSRSLPPTKRRFGSTVLGRCSSATPPIHTVPSARPKSLHTPAQAPSLHFLRLFLYSIFSAFLSPTATPSPTLPSISLFAFVFLSSFHIVGYTRSWFDILVFFLSTSPLPAW